MEPIMQAFWLGYLAALVVTGAAWWVSQRLVHG